MLRPHWNRIPTQLLTAFIAFALVLCASLDADAKRKKKKRGKGKKAKVAMVAENDKAKADDTAEKKKNSGDVDMDIGEDEVSSDSKDKSSDTSLFEESQSSDADAEPEKKEEVKASKASEESTDTASDDVETSEESESSEEDIDLDVEVEASSDSASEANGILATVFETDAVARRDRGINLLTAHSTRKGALTLIVDHRPYKNLFSKSDAFFDFLGLDRGESLKVGLGFRYGIIDGLDFGFYRLNDGGLVKYDTYEFDLRYVFLNQDKQFVNLMARAGGSWFSQKGAHALGGFAQVFVDRVLFDVLLVGAGFAFHSESSSEYKARDENLGKDVETISGAITGVIEWRALDMLAITAEIAAPVVGYKQEYPSGTLALKFLTHRHTFSIMLTTAQFINADGIVTGTWRKPNELVFGMQLFREFNLFEY